MVTKDGELRTSVKLKKSTLQMIRKTGISGDTIDELIRRLLFKDKNEVSGKDPLYVKKGLV
jgi:hypothetical protein